MKKYYLTFGGTDEYSQDVEFVLEAWCEDEVEAARAAGYIEDKLDMAWSTASPFKPRDI